MRIAAHELGPQPNPAEQFGDAFLQLAAMRDIVGDERLADDLEQRPARIERRVGVLEDHLGVASQRLQLAPVEFGDIHNVAGFASEQHFASAGLNGAQDAATCRRLAAATLADQPERVAFADDETHIVYGGGLPSYPTKKSSGDRKRLGQVAHLEQRRLRQISHPRAADVGGLPYR
jgi:hypothetical protein